MGRKYRRIEFSFSRDYRRKAVPKTAINYHDNFGGLFTVK